MFGKMMLTCGVMLTMIASVMGQETATALGRPMLVADYGGNKVAMVDAAGKIIWQHAAVNAQDVWRLPNGNILFSHLHGAMEVTADDKKQVVWEYRTEAPNEVHNCQPLPNGHVLIGECGSCRLIEVDRQGHIAKEIKFQTATTRVHLQIRLARKTPAGTYLVGFYHEGVAREFDSEGNIIRTFKGVRNVWGAIRLPNGNTLLSCGDGHTLIEIDPDDKVVWQLNENDLPDNPLRFVAGVQRLPNGNTIVCNWLGHGFTGKQPQILEVTPDKHVIRRMFDNTQFKTPSHIMLLDVPGDVTRGEIWR